MCETIIYISIVDFPFLKVNKWRAEGQPEAFAIGLLQKNFSLAKTMNKP